MWNKTVLKLQPNFSVDKFTKKHFWVLQLSQLYYHDYRLLLHGTKVIFFKIISMSIKTSCQNHGSVS